MSCENCERETGEHIAYYRWGTANVGMLGCRKHLLEIFEVLTTAQDKQRAVLNDGIETNA